VSKNQRLRNEAYYRLMIALNLDDQIVSDYLDDCTSIEVQNKLLEKNLNKMCDQVNYCSNNLRQLKKKNKKLKLKIRQINENEEGEIKGI